jgi:excisionase family DNA binding protein
MSTSRERGPARDGRKRSQSAVEPSPSRATADKSSAPTRGSTTPKSSAAAPPSAATASASPSARPAAVDDAGLSEVRFLTVAEVASVMRVSKMTVYRLVHSGELPAVRVGRSFRVPDQAVHDYLRAAYIEAG